MSTHVLHVVTFSMFNSTCITVTLHAVNSVCLRYIAGVSSGVHVQIRTKLRLSFQPLHVLFQMLTMAR